MHKLLLSLLLGLIFIGCKKDSDPIAADAAAKIAGTYTISSYSTGPVTIAFPYTQAGVTNSGTIVVTKKTTTTVDMTVTFKATGQADDTDSVTGVTVSGTDLTYNNQKIGTADGTTLTLSSVDNGVTSSITAKK